MMSFSSSATMVFQSSFISVIYLVRQLGHPVGLDDLSDVDGLAAFNKAHG